METIYDQAYNTLFHQNVESVQYNAPLAVMGAVRGTSIEKLCQENIPQLHRKHDFLNTLFYPRLWKGETIWTHISEYSKALVFSKAIF